VMRGNVHTTGEALAYIVDCTLATVSQMAMRKKPPVGEFNRQISIAQTGVNWIREMNVACGTTRAHSVIASFDGSVEKWAQQYRPQP
jgi:hypothetical protein